MKHLVTAFFALTVLAFFTGCEPDAGKLPIMNFKTGSNYTAANATIAVDSSFTIGIDATKAEKRDVLKKFDISVSVNGGATTSVFSKDLSGSEQDNYSYDYTAVATGNAGDTRLYTFTATNRDGLVKQIYLTITLQ